MEPNQTASSHLSCSVGSVLGLIIERMWPPVHPPAEQLEASHPHPDLGISVLPTVPTARAVFKDIALREQGVVETMWAVYVTEPVKASM